MTDFQRAARKWVGVWRGAGCWLKMDGGKIRVSPNLVKLFPDSRHIVECLRDEIVQELSIAAVPPEGNHNAAQYAQYLENLKRDAEERERLAQYYAKRAG